jgi:hypothetical protein
MSKGGSVRKKNQTQRDFGKRSARVGGARNGACSECKDHHVAVVRVSLCFSCYAREYSTLKSYIKQRKKTMMPKRDASGKFIGRLKK